MGRNPTRAARRLTGMSSPIAFDDTQFDLDLSDHLDQFSDGPEVAPAAGGHGDLVDDQRGVDDFDGVVPVGDPGCRPTRPCPPIRFEPEPEPVAAVDDAAADTPDGRGRARRRAGARPGRRDSAVVGWVERRPTPPRRRGRPRPVGPDRGWDRHLGPPPVAWVDPPTSVHSVFAVTPPQGTPAVAVPAVPPAPPAVASAFQGGSPPSPGVAVLAAVLAARSRGRRRRPRPSPPTAVVMTARVAAADAPGQSVALPPAGAEADKPDDAPAPGTPSSPGRRRRRRRGRPGHRGGSDVPRGAGHRRRAGREQPGWPRGSTPPSPPSAVRFPRATPPARPAPTPAPSPACSPPTRARSPSPSAPTPTIPRPAASRSSAPPSAAGPPSPHPAQGQRSPCAAAARAPWRPDPWAGAGVGRRGGGGSGLRGCGGAEVVGRVVSPGDDAGRAPRAGCPQGSRPVGGSSPIGGPVPLSRLPLPHWQRRLLMAVGPPRERGTTWSIWQWRPGTAQPGSRQQSRMMTASRRGPVA